MYALKQIDYNKREMPRKLLILWDVNGPEIPFY